MLLFREINFESLLFSLAIMVGLAVVLGAAILIIGKVFFVKKDPRVEEITEMLPKANCGGCGHPGCEGFAQALVEGKGEIDDCGIATGESKVEIANILGKNFTGGEPTTAVVACVGGNACQDKFDYQGYGSCTTQEMLAGGRKACKNGCMGSGTCSEICPSTAINIKDGVAKVDKALCISCGLCIKACPKKIIKRIPESAKLYVACASVCKGKEVMSFCKNGCISCGICVRNCEFGAIELVDNVPIINYQKCTACLKCVEKCPKKVIKLM